MSLCLSARVLLWLCRGSCTRPAPGAWLPLLVWVLWPDYLAKQVAVHAQNYAASQFSRFGVVIGCPNVVLVSSPKEAGPQGYEFLLRESHECTVDPDALRQLLKAEDYSDILVFPGGFDLEVCLPLIGETAARVYIDANF